MKTYITSTTGKVIHFTLNKERKFIIDPVVPSEVTAEEFKILNERLGHQLSVANISSPVTVEVTPEAEAPIAPVEETSVEVPVVESV